MTKKILYLTTRLPYPVIGGDKLRIYNILKQLKILGYDITLVSLVSKDDNLKSAQEHNEFYTRLIPVSFNKKFAYINAVKALFNDKPFIVEYFYSSAMQKVVDKLLKEEKFDIISGYMIRIAPYLEKYTNQNVIIDIVDAVSMMYERRIKTVKSLFDKLKIGIEFIKVKNYEKKCCRIFKSQTVISKVDKKYIESFSPKSNIHIIPNGVDTDYYKPIPADREKNICFVGAMRTIANSEAVKYFATEVFPIIKEVIPEARFKVIGAEPRQDLINSIIGIEGVDILGKVNDVREHMKTCKVSVCSTKIAGGVQNKVLEAMSIGIPVVATPEGAEGIDADESILAIAKTNEEYAQKVIALMNNEELNNRISKLSRDFIIQNFSWDKVSNKLNKLFLKG